VGERSWAREAAGNKHIVPTGASSAHPRACPADKPQARLRSPLVNLVPKVEEMVDVIEWIIAVSVFS
jgi:hypothetical protein